MSCSDCRHAVIFTMDGEEAMACHGPGARIFSPKKKEWTEDRETFNLAARRVGLHNYQWTGRVICPGDHCEDHQTKTEAFQAGVPKCQITERFPRTKKETK